MAAASYGLTNPGRRTIKITDESRSSTAGMIVGTTAARLFARM
jgi:hypothetical protein